MSYALLVAYDPYEIYEYAKISSKCLTFRWSNSC